MDYQEAIENHINECRHRIDVINDFMKSNEYNDKDKCNKNIKVLKTAISAMQELQEYKQLGTLEEVREAVEKQKAKKPYEFGWVTGLTGQKIYKRGRCKNCGCLNVSCNTAYCNSCGQHIDWSEVQE